MSNSTLPRTAGRRGDRLFHGLSRGAGVLTLVLLVAIGVFLVVEAVPALRANTASFLTTTEWSPDSDPVVFGIAALAFGTIVSSVIALVIAVPVAVGAALFIAFYAPRRVASPFAYMVDLLAAVPSVVYGLWGLYALMPPMIKVSRWLDHWFGWIPLFHSVTGTYGRSLFVAGVILAIMILPIISAISREVLLQVPTTQREAAIALGSTRWQMLRTAALPFARSGIVSASMLGLGRALGETIAVALVLSASYDISWHILEPGGNTFAANIALKFGESGATGRGALIASGLVLFAITLVVNFAARYVVVRKNLVHS